MATYQVNESARLSREAFNCELDKLLKDLRDLRVIRDAGAQGQVSVPAGVSSPSLESTGLDASQGESLPCSNLLCE